MTYELVDKSANSLKFSFRKTNASTYRLVTVSPAVEKSFSLAVDVAGTHKIDLAILD